MRQTIEYIPHDFIAFWALPLWIVVVVLLIALQAARHGWTKEATGLIWVGLVGAGIIYFVLPGIEVTGPDPSDPLQDIVRGLPIRGFGVMFLVALLVGVGMVVRRARSMQVDSEAVLSLAFWMFLAGIVGARTYYVVQYWEDFQRPTLRETVVAIANTTSGGIVVYGSLIGGLIAGVVYCRYRKLPMLATADLIVPGMAMGLAIGRIGCFLNGCCYGGPCDLPVAVQFPMTAPSYLRQLETGEVIGIRSRDLKRRNEEGENLGWREVVSIRAGSIAAARGIEVGDRIRSLPVPGDLLERMELGAEIPRDYTIQVEGRPELNIPLTDLPRWTEPVHPTQLYSALNACLLSLLLWFYYPFRYGDGEVMGLGLAAYAVSRFLLEAIRVDEPGQLNTELSTAQWVSLPMFALGIVLILVSRFWIRHRAFPPVSTADRAAVSA